MEEPAQTTSIESGKASMATASELTNEQIENIVRRSYQYVAMYNVNGSLSRSRLAAEFGRLMSRGD